MPKFDSQAALKKKTHLIIERMDPLWRWACVVTHVRLTSVYIFLLCLGLIYLDIQEEAAKDCLETDPKSFMILQVLLMSATWGDSSYS